MMRIGGYQGKRSIMTTALESLRKSVVDSGMPQPVLLEDVTAEGITARALLAAVEEGGMEICYMASGYLAARIPELSVLDAPFHVKDRKAALERLDGEAGRILSTAMARSTGLKVLAYWDNGFRHISNRLHPIRAPGDCLGLTIRTIDSPNYIATLSAIGFDPIAIDVAHFREAVAKGQVDAQENPITNMLNFGVDRYHRHVSLTSHLFGVALLVCNRLWHDRLSKRDRHGLEAAVFDATQQQRRLAANEDVVSLNELVAAGVSVILPDQIDLSGFQSHVSAVKDELLASQPKNLRAAYSGI